MNKDDDTKLGWVSLDIESTKDVIENALDTSRSRAFNLKGVFRRYTWNANPAKEVTRFDNFEAIITEEILSIGNVSTHIKLMFNWGTLVAYKNVPVVLKCYDKERHFLYDIPFPDLRYIRCGQARYDSGLIRLEHNHFDTIRFVTPEFPHKLKSESNRPCDE